ncbi:NOP protein chaperone 1 [Pholidichthys leucotaenia]
MLRRKTRRRLPLFTMELNGKKTSSRDLLSCDSGGGIREKLLLRAKPGRLRTDRVPRSSVLERLQRFLPQMARANERLKQRMEEAPAGLFDIENVEEAEKIIEMDVALVELSESDGDSEEDEMTSQSEQESDSSDDDDGSKITEQNLRLPGSNVKRKKVDIQVLDQQGESDVGTSDRLL